ncbi:branched-chain amino acid ABC transporter substrate-binding protein [Candidatus Chlorohelix sp.]|uniref:branched-chain amino acid ABC transporter substrate-binding protein n=1 Tax=Candidatus Chlorohelix sp. TaxID=3139201 RepID=UPI003042940E
MEMKNLKKLSLLFLLLLGLQGCGAAVGNATTSSQRVDAVLAPDVAVNYALVQQNSGTIRIYSSLPLTGSSKEQSLTLTNAMQMALEDVAGPDKTINGFKIDFVSLDDATAQRGQWDETTEKANATQAANDPDAMVFLGPYNSGAAQVAIPILNRAGLPIISPSNTYPGLTLAVDGITKTGEPDNFYPTKTRNYFRVVARDDWQGPAIVLFAREEFKVKRLYLVSEPDLFVYGKGLTDSVEREASKYGISIVGRSTVQERAADYRNLARKIRDAKPDMVFFGGTAQNQPGRLLADVRAAGVTVPFMGGDGFNNPAFLKSAGVAGEVATYSSISGVPENLLPTKGQDFLKRYRARFGTPTNYTLHGYEVMSVALNAIKNAGKKDRKAILNAIAATKNFEGVLGRWSFDANGDTDLTDFAIYQIKDGLFAYQRQSKPSK